MSNKTGKSPKAAAESPTKQAANEISKALAKLSKEAANASADKDSSLNAGEPKPPSALSKRINALKHVQRDMIKLEARFYEELHELECKYNQLYEPFYEKRRAIISGEQEPSEEESVWPLDDENKDNEAAATIKEFMANLEASHNGDAKGISKFWFDTLQTYRITAELIQEYDEPILAYLTDIRLKMAEQKPYGYTLEFHFDENPFFTNKVLTKTYELKTDVDEKDPFAYQGPDLAKAIGCKIDWKQGQNVTVKIIKKKVKSKNKKAPPKIITKEEKQVCLANWASFLKEIACIFEM